MQPSMELRWFVQGLLDDELSNWFENSRLGPHTMGEFIPSIDERADTYLGLPYTAELGVKLRNRERIEIKKRVHDQGIQTLGADIEGCLEQWVKWSFLLSLQNSNSLNTSLLGDAWIIVQKVRRTRKFEVRSASLVKEVDPNSKPEDVPEGCNLELTTLRVQNQSWYSLGFEAFGQLASVEKNLELVVREALSHSRFPPMKARDSFGYPEWLRKILLSQRDNIDVLRSE
jgi:hypothetical protein